MAETYKCAACGGVFEKGRSDEEALDEKDRLWPDFNLRDCSIVCDDCFKSMGFSEAGAN